MKGLNPMANLPTTGDYLNELKKQRELLAAKLASEGMDVSNADTFNKLVEEAGQLYAAEQTYNAESKKAQSGIAVAEGIDKSVGDINGALSNLIEPSDIDPVEWMDKTVDAALEEIKEQNAVTIADQIQSATETLSTENTATIKEQIADAVANLDISTRRAFLSNVKRVKDGNIILEENTIYVVVRTPDGNTLNVYNPDTLEPITLSDRHYCIITGNVGDDVPGAVCATVLSYPSLDPQLYVIKNDTLQSTMNWSGVAIFSSVKNALVE
jgi:hypothetical protein